MISIIVPIYNAEKWIERCVDSLICQTYTDIEILLINDGSTDRSLEICNTYAEKDNRITVIDKENEGVSATRNLGLQKARGEFIQFVDCDDYVDSQMCEKMLGAIENADLVLCGLNVWKNGVLLRKPHLERKTYDLKESIDIYFKLRKINLGPCNKLYRKEKISNGFRKGLSLGEDTLFVLDYMKDINRVSVLDDCLYNVVLDNDNSLNRNKPNGYLRLLIEQRKKEEEFLIDKYGADCDLTQMYNQYLLNTHAYFMQSEISKQTIAEYITDAFLRDKIKKSNPQRFDYKVFKALFVFKSMFGLRMYFKIKTGMLKCRKI